METHLRVTIEDCEFSAAVIARFRVIVHLVNQIKRIGIDKDKVWRMILFFFLEQCWDY
jgi:hypothetical protein